MQTKATLWCQRLNGSRAETLPARQLYSGDHWSIARSLESASTASGAGVRLWIASAGYGLIAMDTLLKPYSATFSSDHPDSIAKGTISEDRVSVVRHWWDAMSQHDIAKTAQPRTIADIAADAPTSPLLIIASENYLRALQQDVLSAMPLLNNVELLSIFSAGCRSLDNLTEHLVPYDARMQHVVGGALRSLNMRVAQLALSSCRGSPPTYAVLRQKLSRLMRQQPDLTRFDRQPMTDDDVRSYILKELREESTGCHTPLLRKLRDTGHACEQKRFARLFREVREHLNGT
ncbi:MAG: hypothetical protein KDB27_35185 [Planctomycetales bacterium]|nr:hypothetical protein [Planctomycetales bacterium]